MKLGEVILVRFPAFRTRDRFSEFLIAGAGLAAFTIDKVSAAACLTTDICTLLHGSELSEILVFALTFVVLLDGSECVESGKVIQV